MFMILPVILSLLVAVILRRPIARLADVRLRHPWIVLAAIMLQVGMFTEPSGAWFARAGLVPVLNTATYALSLLFCLLNIQVRSLGIVALGTLLNGLAILVNGGYMPADPVSAARTANTHLAKGLAAGTIVNNSIPFSEATRLPLLTDIFHMPAWMPLANVFSIGDIVIAVGAFFLIQELLTPQRVK